MGDAPDRYERAEWMQSLDEIDREIVRLALLCGASILAPGIIERVLRRDSSVCATDNPVAFEKLRGMLTMHFGLWEKAAEELGPAQTSQIEQSVIERLKSLHPELAGRLSGTF
jgi:hypothetical protein